MAIATLVGQDEAALRLWRRMHDEPGNTLAAVLLVVVARPYFNRPGPQSDASKDATAAVTGDVPISPKSSLSCPSLASSSFMSIKPPVTAGIAESAWSSCFPTSLKCHAPQSLLNRVASSTTATSPPCKCFALVASSSRPCGSSTR